MSLSFIGPNQTTLTCARFFDYVYSSNGPLIGATCADIGVSIYFETTVVSFARLLCRYCDRPGLIPFLIYSFSLWSSYNLSLSLLKEIPGRWFTFHIVKLPCRESFILHFAVLFRNVFLTRTS